MRHSAMGFAERPCLAPLGNGVSSPPTEASPKVPAMRRDVQRVPEASRKAEIDGSCCCKRMKKAPVPSRTPHCVGWSEMFTFGQCVLHTFARLRSRGVVSSAGPASDLCRVPTVWLTKGLCRVRADPDAMLFLSRVPAPLGYAPTEAVRHTTPRSELRCQNGGRWSRSSITTRADHPRRGCRAPWQGGVDQRPREPARARPARATARPRRSAARRAQQCGRRRRSPRHQARNLRRRIRHVGQGDRVQE